MADSWQSFLARWTDAGLLDAVTAERIRQFEASHEKTGQLRWPILIAVGFGAIMLAAGVLLFVSAHWDQLSPGKRFSLLLLLLAAFHVAGTLTSERFPVLATALHGVGTVALGAAIFLSAQIFNLQEHWPSGILLWALGAWMGVGLLRDWVQAALAAVLTPGWLAAEWIERAGRYSNSGAERILGLGLLLVSIAYLTALFDENRGNVRRAMAWIGGIALIPSAVIAMPESWYGNVEMPGTLLFWGYALGFLLPMLLALKLRGKAAWMNAAATAWVVVLALLPNGIPNSEFALRYSVRVVGPYLWCGMAALGLIAWGIREARRERISLGVLGFGLTILTFYFAQVMDKLSRSASLMGLGLLFLVLAWALERTRRKLVARIGGAA
jgi:uncharacterized membrane protein